MSSAWCAGKIAREFTGGLRIFSLGDRQKKGNHTGFGDFKALLLEFCYGDGGVTRRPPIGGGASASRGRQIATLSQGLSRLLFVYQNPYFYVTSLESY